MKHRKRARQTSRALKTLPFNFKIKKLKELKNLLCPLVLPKHPRVVETNNFSKCSDCNS